MYNSNFIFNGYKSEDLNLHIVSLTKENFVSVPVSRAEDSTNISFEVDIAYANINNEPLEIDSTARRLIYSTLIKEEYAELELPDYPDIVFYAKFIPLKANINASGMGYFTFRIETNSTVAYSKVKEYEVINDSDSDKEIVFSSYDNLNIDTIAPFHLLIVLLLVANVL